VPVVSEIYRTVLGESQDSGRLCSIVRLTGCHRRCTYCDSAHSFHGGESLDVAEVVERVRLLEASLVLVTGGEPLLQVDGSELMQALLDDGRDVVLETSGTVGARPLSGVPAGVRRVVDVKTPGSGIPEAEIDWDGLASLGAGDELKFVCCDRRDYEWARDLIRDGGRLPAATLCSLSPVHGQLDSRTLADWIVADALNVRFQIQLHKIVWPDRDRGV
jgi:7-carboxy-7-deazaguanine synthase